MLPPLLATLEFRSNNERHRPVIRALELVKKYASSKVHTFPSEEDMPINGVVRGLWQEAVEEKDKDGNTRVNRITYEICALEALRTQLRCKEIWVVGANRYRNPDDDLPADFDAQRTEYYEALKLPANADDYVAGIRREMEDALASLNSSIPQNSCVKIIISKKGGRIRLTPLEPQPE